MERITFKNSKGLNLIGNYYQADSDAVIVMSHGFAGDKSQEGKFDKTAEALNKYGFNVFNFDFSGCGESDNDSLTVGKQVEDLQCAIKYLQQNKGLKRIGLLGLSMGGLISLKVYSEVIETMVLWAPLTNKIKDFWKYGYTPEQLKELEETGKVTILRDKNIRRETVVDKQIKKELEEVDQKLLCLQIKCPVLIINGDRDKKVTVEDSKSAMKYLPKSSELEIIVGADHHFSEQLDQLIDFSVSWFQKYLTPNR